MAYDSKSFVQSRGLEWSEFEAIVGKMIGEVMRAAEDIAEG